MPSSKKTLSLPQILNLNFGLFGIQFAWVLVTINISGIYTFFGASQSELAFFWLIPSIIGIVLPPIVGLLSDKTYTSFGKRIPYIFTGAFITAICMCLLPNSLSLGMAIILFCFFIGAINTALQPFRPLVTDIVPIKLHTKLYAIQAGIIGIGALFASGAPWFLLHLTKNWQTKGQLPAEIEYSLYIGAIIILLASAWSSLTGKKYLSPEKKPIKQKTSAQREPILNKIKTITQTTLSVPKLMWQISYVQIFTWLGTFCFLVYFTPTIEQIIFHMSPTAHVIHNQVNQHYLEKSVILTDIASVIYMFVNVIFAYCIPFLSNKFARKKVHIFSLVFGGLSLISIGFIHSSDYLFLAMIGIGMAWASFNSIPFAMFASVTPKDKSGLFLGIFNISICLPQIFGSLLVGFILKNWLHNKAVYIIILAGLFYLIAALLTLPIKDKTNHAST